MNRIKEISINIRTYCFFDDMINIKNIDSYRIKRDKKPKIKIKNKSIIIYYIGYITIKSLNYVKINSINPLTFLLRK